MRQIIRTLLVSVVMVVLVVTTIASIWLALEKRRLTQQYLKDNQLWSIRNATLKEMLNRSEESINNLKQELEKISKELENSSRELGVLRTSYEELKESNISLERKLKNYSQEKNSLLAKISQLEKELTLSEQARKEKETQEDFWARILREKVDLEVRARDLEKKIMANRTMLAGLEEERNNLEEQLNQAQAEKIDLENNLIGKNEATPRAPRDVLRSKLKREELEKSLMDLAIKKSELENRIGPLKLRIEKVEAEKQAMFTQMNKVNQLLEDRLTEVNQVHTEVNRVHQELETALSRAKQIALSGSAGLVELPAVVVKKEGTLRAKPEVTYAFRNDVSSGYPARLKFLPPKIKETQVVLVNEAHNFVILNIGKIDGIVEGMSFEIYEDKDKIAKVKIKEVRDRLSAARILEISAHKKIKSGATAVYSQ